MVHYRLLFLSALLLAVVWIFQTGCKEENAEEPPAKPKLAPLTNLRAYSAAEVGSVGLRWNSSVDSANAQFLEIQITVKDGNTVFSLLNVPKTITDTVVRSLVDGTIYTFEVMAKAPTSSSALVSNSDPAVIRWAPARRFTTTSGNEIRLYETTAGRGDTLNPSGLSFLDPSTQEPKRISMSNPRADSLLIDIFVQTDNANSVSLQSANNYGGVNARPSLRVTRFSSASQDVASLNDPRVAPPDTNSYLAGITSRGIDASPVTSSRIYFFRSYSGNYGRILVKQDPATRSLIWGTAPNRFLNLEISYQTRAGVPFAKPVPAGRKASLAK